MSDAILITEATPAASTFDHAALMEDMAKYDDLVAEVVELMVELRLMNTIDIDKLSEEEFEDLAKVRDGLVVLRRTRAW